MKMNACLRVLAMVMVIITILPALPSGWTTEDAEAQITPDVMVSVNPHILMVDVSPTGTGIVQSQITLENLGVHIVTVLVTIDLDGYHASPNQISVTLTPGQIRYLPMSVAAMLRSEYRLQAGKVIATVRSVNGVPIEEYFYNEAGFFVQTSMYSRLVLEAKDPYIKVWPGKVLKLKFEVLNEGNIDDEVRLDVVNRDALYRSGFSIAQGSSGSQLISPGSRDPMTLHVTTPKSRWEDSYYSVDVRAVSSFQSSQPFDYSVILWVRGVYVPGFDPIPALISLFVAAAIIGRKKDGESIKGRDL